jgi:hypothetical protein
VRKAAACMQQRHPRARWIYNDPSYCGCTRGTAPVRLAMACYRRVVVVVGSWRPATTPTSAVAIHLHATPISCHCQAWGLGRPDSMSLCWLCKQVCMLGWGLGPGIVVRNVISYWPCTFWIWNAAECRSPSFNHHHHHLKGSDMKQVVGLGLSVLQSCGEPGDDAMGFHIVQLIILASCRVYWTLGLGTTNHIDLGRVIYHLSIIFILEC